MGASTTVTETIDPAGESSFSASTGISFNLLQLVIIGIDLSITDYLLIAFVSVVGSAATAGLTGAVVMLTLTLSTLGLPLAGVGLLLAIDPILDMMRTATNVAGQALVPVIVARRQGILDVAQYHGPNGDGLPEEAPAKAPADAQPQRSTRRPAADAEPVGARG
ncbi:dicarboxylate/amino acid:cation symporter [Nakamurella sp. YIM 132084]|uniref:Dicarboxylate/amino acid:cation symporter n=1 Tax=Nakamurella leprariae TaxID=2803911 RepID=A0A938YBF0_9ACTN|nr:cation:dicarboxylase symporter family transporter [Nakamurella leprariae]MBM9466543.1 dicarboxylate/amino acid:cation symporter [Nakamurella leprariae]